MIKVSLIKLLTLLLTLYFASIVVFFQNYINVTYVINLLLIIIFLLLMLINKEINYKVNGIIKAYFLFVILGFASSFWAIDAYDASFKSLQLFLILINMFIMYNLSKKFHLENTFLNGILLASLVNYVLMLEIIQVPFEIIMPGGGMRAMGTVGNPNVLSIVMLISILASSIYLNKKNEISKSFYYYQYFNILLALYMIVLTVSKKGIIAGSLLIIIYFLLSMKSLKGIVKLGYLSLIIILSIIYFIDLNDIIYHYEKIMIRFNASFGAGDGWDSTSIRKNLILSGLDVIQNKPLFGHGLDNFRYVSFNGQYAHNNYIEVLANVGLIGGIIFYSMYIYLIKKIFDMKNKNLKIIFLLFLFIFLGMDAAVVSYNSKHLLFTLLFIYIFAENDSYNREKKIND